MHAFDLYALRENFNRQHIRLCFNGPISRGLIGEIGNALKNYLTVEQVAPGAAMDVLAVYIEMTQNIRHYSAARGYSEQNTEATVVISRDDDGHYVVAAGNMIEKKDGRMLLERIEELAQLDKSALKLAYKEQLRKPRVEGITSGAGLGLIDIARKASLPLNATLSDHSNGLAFFSLFAVI